MHIETLKEVLKPRPAVAVRNIKPADIKPGTLQAKLVEEAAAKVKGLYYAGKRKVGYDPERPEPFFDACVDTYTTIVDVEQTVPDERVASIALAVFEKAFFGERLLPTTLKAQVEMQIEAVETARRLRLLFAEQQAFAV